MKKFPRMTVPVVLALGLAACRSGNMAAVSEQSDSSVSIFESALVIPDSGSEFSYRLVVHQSALEQAETSLSVIWKVTDRQERSEFACKDLAADKSARQIPVEFGSNSDDFSTTIAVAKTFFDRCDFKSVTGMRILPESCLSTSGDRRAIGNRIDSCLFRNVGGKLVVLAQATATPLPIAVILKNRGLKELLSPEERSRAFNLEDIDDVVSYGEMCAKSMGPIPEFSCLDGEIIKIFKNGDEQIVDQEKCDNPSYIASGGGECQVYSRVGRLQMTNPNVDAVFTCRHYKAARSLDDPNFQDIAIIQHDRVSGDTCWFQALAAEQVGQADLNGIRVAPPTEEAVAPTWKLPDQFNAVEDQYGRQVPMNSRSFWLRPSRTAEIACIRCHDSDPYLRTPNIAEIKRRSESVSGKRVVPCDPGDKDAIGSSQCDSTVFKGHYRNLGKFMGRWEVAYAIEPRHDDQCVQCHRIGSLGTRDYLASDAVGEQLQQAEHRTNLSLSFPKNHWMGPDHLKRTKNDWDKEFERPWRSLKFCLENWIQRKGPNGQNANFQEHCKATRFEP
jgi:hypothetical protein